MPEQPAPKPHRPLTLLVVEDEMMVAMSLETLLDTLGHQAIIAGRLQQACEIAGTSVLDGALLDINIRGEAIYPVAEALERRGIPFAFMTGYDTSAVDARWRDRPTLEKPFDPDSIAQLIDSFAASATHSG